MQNYLLGLLMRIYVRVQAQLIHSIPPVLVGIVLSSVVIYMITHSCSFEEVC